MVSGATFDLDFATRFLAARYGAGSNVPSELPGGEWSKAYTYAGSGSQWVIRFSPHGEDFSKDELAGRYASPDLPIPTVAERGQVPGGWYAITPRLTGAFLEQLDEAAFARTLPAVLGLMDAMAAADTSSFDGFGPWDGAGRGLFPSWRSYVLAVGTDDPRWRTHGWRSALSSHPEAERVFDLAMTALTDAVGACPEDRGLVHADLLHRNVFVDGDRVAGVIDWGNAMYGDSLYDAAALAFWAPWYPVIDEAAVVDSASRLPGASARFGERMRTYRLHIGLEDIAYNLYLGGERDGELMRVCRRTADAVRGH